MMELTNDQKIDFIKKAAFIADLSQCNYKIGCVGVIENNNYQIPFELKKDTLFRIKKNLIYIKSFNETLKGEIYCQQKDSTGCKSCYRKEHDLKGKEFEKVCTIHAEQNLIAKFAKYGLPTNNMILFLTNTPCYICAKSIIQAGVKEVYYLSEHTDTSAMGMLKENGVGLIKLGF